MPPCFLLNRCAGYATSTKLPIDYQEFLRYLESLRRAGLNISGTGARLIAYANGLNNLQGHVKQAFYGVQLFLIHNKSIVGTLAAYDITKSFPLEGKILSKWVRFLRGRNDKTNEYDLQVLKDILPTYAGGVQVNGRGAIAEVRRSLVPVAQILMKKGYKGIHETGDLDSKSDGPPSKRKQTILRTVRDTEMVRRMKTMYGFACQVCGFPPIQIRPNEFYVEGHHLRPLGGIHKGSDTQDNIVLLCPNHHVLFDKFAMSIDPSDGQTIVSRSRTRTRAKMLMMHRLRTENVRYHYQRFISSSLK